VGSRMPLSARSTHGESAMEDDWNPDRTAAWLGVAFIVLLLASEAALTLPDVGASAVSVATFYAQHRGVIVVLQVLGFVACGLLGLFAWRLNAVDRLVAVAGLVLAVAAAVPGVITVWLAATADPADPAPAGNLNELEPRGDDVLFVGITLFAAAVLLTRAAAPAWLRGLALVTAIACLLRLVLEVIGGQRGLLDSLGPIAFLLLVGGLVVVEFRGHRRGRASAHAR
jgi:hypothetical protein